MEETPKEALQRKVRNWENRATTNDLAHYRLGATQGALQGEAEKLGVSIDWGCDGFRDEVRVVTPKK